MATVAVCEDDTAVRSVLRRALEHDGHTVLTSGTGSALLAQLASGPDLLILDLGLPDTDGRDLCLAVRAAGCDRPVLMLTALDAVHHKVSGFEAGADDYLTKPFDVPELLVRVRALLKRSTGATVHDGVHLDPARHAVIHDDRSEDLSPTEFRILGRLMGARGEAVRRHALVAAGWPHGAQVSDNTLDSYVRRIRTKLDLIGAADRLATVRGVGYRWD
jgi:DNA-binding response OmpR family regulator